MIKLSYPASNMRKCTGPCGMDLDDTCFGKINGYLRRVCKSCKYKQRSKIGIQKQAKRNSERLRKMRREQPAVAILQDSRRSDKKKGRKNDLEITFIENIIKCPCSYCGETSLRMTLDRKDNHIGHIKNNVVGACLRCNYARGNMPYEAWLFLVPGLRQAREAGAFGEWTGRVHNIFVGVPKMDKGPVCKTGM